MAYVYEFLYRGRADETGDFHVILAEDVEVFGETKTNFAGPMIPAKAEDLGFGLPALLAGFESGLHAENETLKTDLATVNDELAAIKGENETLAKANDALGAENDTLHQRITELNAALAEKVVK